MRSTTWLHSKDFLTQAITRQHFFLSFYYIGTPGPALGNAADYPLHTLEENTGERGTSELDPTLWLPDCHLSGRGMS